MAKHLETGLHGEQLAANYLKAKGYEVLTTNWRFRRSEIDIIAKDGPVLVFVEVKTRSYDYYGKPESFVDDKKKKMLIDGAAAYMRKINHQWEIRFDIVGIILNDQLANEIRHFKDAFFPGLQH